MPKLSDEKLLEAWYQACDDLAAQREKTKDLHLQVQERQLGPYAQEAATSISAEESLASDPEYREQLERQATAEEAAE